MVGAITGATTTDDTTLGMIDVAMYVEEALSVIVLMAVLYIVLKLVEDVVEVGAGAATGATTVVGTTVGMTVDETWTEDLLSVTVLKPVL